jgi:hypothetical protein
MVTQRNFSLVVADYVLSYQIIGTHC